MHPHFVPNIPAPLLEQALDFFGVLPTSTGGFEFILSCLFDGLCHKMILLCLFAAFMAHKAFAF